MKIEIICIGTIKESYLREGIEEYVKRLQPYSTFQIIERPEARLSQNPSQAEIDQALDEEAEDILKQVSKGSKMVSLCIEGKQFTSEAFSKKIEDWALEGGANISFIIGSSHGLSKTIKQKSEKLSFSKMTFPHQLMRLILLEQVYRGFRILRNEPYHK